MNDYPGLNDSNLAEQRVKISTEPYGSLVPGGYSLELLHTRHDLDDGDNWVCWLRLLLHDDDGSVEPLIEVRRRSLSAPNRGTIKIARGRYQLPQGLSRRQQARIKWAARDLVQEARRADKILDPKRRVKLN